MRFPGPEVTSGSSAGTEEEHARRGDQRGGEVVNLPAWRGHLLDGLARTAVATGDPALAALREELVAYPGGLEHPDPTDIAVPLVLTAPDGESELNLISTRTTFGTAIDVTVAELSIESFFPADAATAEFLQDDE